MKQKIIFICCVLALTVVNFSLNSQMIQKNFTFKELTFMPSANASGENNDCTSSSYGPGAYLKELNCVITKTVYIFPIGWTTTFEDGFMKCCTIDEGAPPDCSCYGTEETVCHKA